MEATTESKLQIDFQNFMIHYPYTRLCRYSEYLVYSPKSNVDKALSDAKELIERERLNLIAEPSTLIGVSTLVIKEKK